MVYILSAIFGYYSKNMANNIFDAHYAILSQQGWDFYLALAQSPSGSHFLFKIRPVPAADEP